MPEYDALSEFRRKPPGVESVTPVSGILAPESYAVPGTYEAFKAVDKRQLRFKIRRANTMWERVPYTYLLRIVEDGSFGTQICLVFTFMVVVIRGRNLQPIAQAIELERCEYVYAFDSNRWDKPTDQKAPFVESIEIHVEADRKREV